LPLQTDWLVYKWIKFERARAGLAIEGRWSVVREQALQLSLGVSMNCKLPAKIPNREMTIYGQGESERPCQKPELHEGERSVICVKLSAGAETHTTVISWCKARTEPVLRAALGKGLCDIALYLALAVGLGLSDPRESSWGGPSLTARASEQGANDGQTPENVEAVADPKNTPGVTASQPPEDTPRIDSKSDNVPIATGDATSAAPIEALVTTSEVTKRDLPRNGNESNPPVTSRDKRNSNQAAAHDRSAQGLVIGTKPPHAVQSALIGQSIVSAKPPFSREARHLLNSTMTRPVAMRREGYDAYQTAGGGTSFAVAPPQSRPMPDQGAPVGAPGVVSSESSIWRDPPGLLGKAIDASGSVLRGGKLTLEHVIAAVW